MIDGSDALLYGFPGCQRAEYAVPDADYPLIWFQAPGQNLNQRAFSRSIVAYNGGDFPAAGLKIHVVKSCDGAEPFHNSIHLNHRSIQTKNSNLYEIYHYSTIFSGLLRLVFSIENVAALIISIRADADMTQSDFPVLPLP